MTPGALLLVSLFGSIGTTFVLVLTQSVRSNWRFLPEQTGTSDVLVCVYMFLLSWRFYFLGIFTNNTLRNHFNRFVGVIDGDSKWFKEQDRSGASI